MFDSPTSDNLQLKMNSGGKKYELCPRDCVVDQLAALLRYFMIEHSCAFLSDQEYAICKGRETRHRVPPPPPPLPSMRWTFFGVHSIDRKRPASEYGFEVGVQWDVHCGHSTKVPVGRPTS